ncbi:hybrid sensor histidine kinase/response regulator transcription factor [Ichthyenterobacterium magnum]|uniref:hybrid sensor histidine kinase/response regulator transcription factor n=1 Tax=Ichthyenterobacterium magnum TaxID=1230530 RepID=UPI000E76345D|nr:hybrid sensor histidine kinase/response regulator transcription factor [Ichthyenterobacterium magnum]
MNYRIFLFFFVTIGLCSQTHQKQVSFRDLTVNDGLSQNSVVSIAQDSTGYMWFATQDGLNKYNGKEFINYNKQFEDVTRPSYSRLGKIYIDRDNNIWIVSNSGVLEKLNKSEDVFNKIDIVANVSTVFQSSNSQLLIGTYNSGLLKVTSSKDTIQVLDNRYNKLTINDFLEINPNEILVAASNHIFFIKGDTYSIVAEQSNINFSTLEKSSNGNIWAGSYGNGLFYKTNQSEGFKQFSGFSKNKLPIDLNVEDLLVDKNNRLWVATYGKGVYVINFLTQDIQHFKANKLDPYALHYNDVLCMYEDYTGTIWLGTDGSGLSYYDEHLTKFNVLTNNQTPRDVNVDVIRSIAINENDFWLGTSGKGLTKINLEQNIFETFTINNSEINSNRVMSLLFDEDKLWIGHQGAGLNLLKDNKFQNFKALENKTIWSILKDENGMLWLATRDDGLLLFDESKGIVKRFNSSNSGLTSNNIRIIAKGNFNEIWVGSEEQGLFRLNLNNDNITVINKIKDKVKSLYYDDNLLWLGTNGNGLKSYNPETKEQENFTITNGLSNNVIYGILPDNQGNLWLSSNKGITKFKKHKNGELLIDNYSNYDGLQALEFNTGAYFKDSNDNLYFGGLEGLNWFNPNQLSFNVISPKTIISKIEIFNEETDLIPERAFKHNQNTITFTFSGLHFSLPEGNHYKYRLINNDADWITSGNTNIAHYTNLPANDYEFQVLSSNYDGVWSKQPSSYKFSILKPWYATNTAKIIYGLLTLLTIFGIYQYFKFRWEVKTQLRLEHAETERLKKLDEFKTKLYTNISHEFRTPLTLISGPVDKQLERDDLLERDKKDLNLVKQNANRLLNLVNQMIDLSLVDSGQLVLKVSKGNLSVLLNQIVEAFQYKSKERSININANISKVNEAYFDKDIIEKVFSNLLTNAIKYSPENSTISFDATTQERALVVSIVNQYDKVARKDLSKLFQRFYQEDAAAEGIGVGLALVKELIVLSKGSIIANNIDDNKIQFTVTLPIHKAAFVSSEIIDQHEIELHQPIDSKLKGNAEHTILIVEDQSDVRNFIVSIFKNDYKIITAKNGEEGIEKTRKNLPDLIISDIMMPIKDGIELCNAIKHNEFTSHIPVILLTAKVGAENEIIGLKSGADAYITKPFNSKRLIVEVDRLIKSRQRLKELYSKAFTINPDLAITSTETEFLKKLQDVLDAHITDPEFKSERMSELLLMSRTQLHRKLKSVYGLSTSEFIRSQRLKLSLQLLKESDATISEVAYQIGFNSPSYYIKCFKETYNLTPSDYSKSL